MIDAGSDNAARMATQEEPQSNERCNEVFAKHIPGWNNGFIVLHNRVDNFLLFGVELDIRPERLGKTDRVNAFVRFEFHWQFRSVMLIVLWLRFALEFAWLSLHQPGGLYRQGADTFHSN